MLSRATQRHSAPALAPDARALWPVCTSSSSREMYWNDRRPSSQRQGGDEAVSRDGPPCMSELPAGKPARLKVGVSPRPPCACKPGTERLVRPEPTFRKVGYGRTFRRLRRHSSWRKSSPRSTATSARRSRPLRFGARPRRSVAPTKKESTASFPLEKIRRVHIPATTSISFSDCVASTVTRENLRLSIAEQHDVIGLGCATLRLHSGRADRHARHGKTFRARLFG